MNRDDSRRDALDQEDAYAVSAPDDFDSPWKTLLDRWTQPFLELFFPVAATDIDWSMGREFLDKELQKVTRKGAQGRREVDKLIKVCRRGGEETWVLVHVEIQGQAQADFARRMYTYHSRLSDRYRRPVASFAVLADSRHRWHPRRYEHRLWGCRAVLEFPSVKLLDYAERETELEADPNPFALVVRAHLAALATQRNPAARLERKITLTRALYRQGWTREDILSLYAFIDWVTHAPRSPRGGLSSTHSRDRRGTARAIRHHRRAHRVQERHRARN